MLKKIVATVITVFIVAGCVGAQPEYKSSNSTYIIFKTPTVAYADQGFISKADSETKVEIYSNGQAVMRLRITPTQVCMSKFACMSGSEFNKKVLNSNYPADTIKNIFSGKEIFNAQGKIDTADGFIQNIGDIKYVVSGNNINFTDSSNGVKIKVTQM